MHRAPELTTCLHTLFERQVERTPDSVAVLAEDRRLTYAQLNAAAERVAARLRVLGVGPDRLVGVFLDRSADLVIALLGVLKAGGAYVPLDPSYPRERLLLMLEDARPQAILTSAALVAALPYTTAPAVLVEACASQVAAPPEPFAPVVSPAHLAYVIFTSGSTGRPKGVMIEHQSIVNHMVWMQAAFPLTQQDVVLQKTPLSFDASVWEFWAPLIAGARLVMAPPGAHKDPAALVEAVERRGVTTLQLVPTLLRLLLDHGRLVECRSLRRLFCGGEALSPDLVRRFVAAHGAELINLYGPTEVTIDATFWRCTSDDGATVPIGRPITGIDARVLDPDFQPVVDGDEGELYLSGPGLARGYLGRPDLTAERFLALRTPSGVEARHYRTGDLVRRRGDGALEYLGRLDDQVKVRGLRIELGEIERTLEAHAAICQAAVVARPGPTGQPVLLAFAVPAPGAWPGTAELRAHLAKTLPEYMVPNSIVELAEMPLSPSGKVDRKRLPTSAPVDAARPPVPPRATEEARIGAIWLDILGVSPAHANDDFMDLGGDSLAVMQLMIRLEQTFQRAFTVESVLSATRLGDLATLVRTAPPVVKRRGLVRLPTKTVRSPLFLVHPVGGDVLCYSELARRMPASQPLYGLVAGGPGSDPVSGIAAASVAEMAEAYLAEIRSTQPRGPYRVGGWSFGGLVAFEMARRLSLRGERVELVALIDTWAPLESMPAAANREEILSELFRRHYAALSGFAPGDDPGTTPPMLAEQMRLCRVNALAAWSHRPDSYDGQVLILRASVQDPRLYWGRNDPEFQTLATRRDLGWGRYVTGGCEVVEVAGDHYSIMRAPAVGQIARILEEHLGRPDSALEKFEPVADVSPSAS